MLSAVIGLLAAAALLWAVLVAALWATQRRIVFQPDTSVASPAAAGVPEMREVRLATADHLSLIAWYWPPPEGAAVVLYLHGNAGNLANRGPRARTVIDAGLGLLLVEYRGFGGNPGRPSEEGLALDAAAAAAFLGAEGVAGARIVLWGESLGTAVAVRLAHERAQSGVPVAAVILEAPFTSVTDIAAATYPWVPVRQLLKDPFDAAVRIASIAAPLLIVHGDADAIVPVRFGRALYQAAAEPKEARWISGGGHEDLAFHGLFETAFAFIQRHVGQPRPALSAPGASPDVRVLGGPR